MKVTYPEQQVPSTIAYSGGSRASLIVLLVILGLAIAVGAVWYTFFKTETPPAVVYNTKPNLALPDAPKGPLFVPQDGVKQCNERFADLATADAKSRRTNCYTAVMIIFGTADICTATLDPLSLTLCDKAQKKYQTFLETKERDAAHAQSNASTGSSGSPGNNTVSSGTGGNTSHGNTANSNGNGTNSNTNSGTATSTVNTNQNGNTNQNSNSTNTNTNQNQSNTNSDTILCRNEKGELVLLQHTNTCQ